MESPYIATNAIRLQKHTGSRQVYHFPTSGCTTQIRLAPEKRERRDVRRGALAPQDILTHSALVEH